MIRACAALGTSFRNPFMCRGVNLPYPAAKIALTSLVSIHWFCFEIPQRGLVTRRVDLLVDPQYGTVCGFNRTADQRSLQDRNAFTVDLFFHQGCLKRLAVGPNLLQLRDCIDRSAAESVTLALIIGRLR